MSEMLICMMYGKFIAYIFYKWTNNYASGLIKTPSIIHVNGKKVRIRALLRR